GRPRIVQRLETALGVHHAAEIAVAFGHGWNIVARRGAAARAQFLPVEEPEGPVAAVVDLGNDHSPADVGAELVADELRRLSVEIRAAARQADAVVHRRLVGGAVDLVGPALGRYDHVRRTAVTGRDRARIQRELIYSAQPRRLAVQRHVVLAVRDYRAIHHPFLRLAGQAENAIVLGSFLARHHRGQVLQVALVDRQLLDARMIHLVV